ncbi:hypothetical protein [uncultured Ruegeria sp.]|uniref:hypothetical protein n=1 Tax=uncultured Ruegeria sp. TaxID=259304 RepID=UPI00262A8207|nr:hypothetical protein [uncultured Ruegeria sp.]
MLLDIWTSFRNLPLWVQIWVSFILVPVNLIPLAFLDQPLGILIAVLAIAGMAFNIPIMLVTRSMSGAMALPHIVFWTPMVVIVIGLLLSGAELRSTYLGFLVILFVVDVISLAFDIRDAARWLANKKAPANGREL